MTILHAADDGNGAVKTMKEAKNAVDKRAMDQAVLIQQSFILPVS